MSSQSTCCRPTPWVTADGDLSLPERAAVRNIVFMEWRKHLSADERDLVSYFMELTIAWGREFVEHTYEQMSRGVPAPEKSGYTWRVPPIEISRAQFYRILDRLKAKGALLVESVQRKFTRIRLNLDWRPAEGIMSPSLAVVRARRKVEASGGTGHKPHGQHDGEPSAAGASQGATRWSQGETNLVSGGDQTGLRVRLLKTHDKTNEQTDERTTSAQSASEALRLPIPKIRQRTRRETNPPRKEELAECLSPAAAPVRAIAIETPEELVQRVKAEHAASRAQRAEKARHGDHPRDYEITFRDAWLEAYPGQSVPTWTQKDCYVLRSTLKARFRDNAVLRHEFLAYTVKNWPFIMSKYFGWMRQSRPPEMPALNFLVREQFLPHFLDAFASSGRDQAVRLLPAEERELATLMDAGATREDALVQIAERRAVSKMEGKNREVRQLNREALMAAGEARRQREEAARAEMRRRAEEAKQRASRPSEPFPELANLPPIKLIELPPLDLSAWN